MNSTVISKPLYRLFFALKPTPVIARQTDCFAESIAKGARRILPDHQHMTLGVTVDYVDYPYGAIKALRRAATAVSGEPFDLHLDHLSIGNLSAALRPSRTVPQLKELQQQIMDAMAKAQVAVRPGWSFAPHQTLFYREARPEHRRVDGFCWAVQEFVLVCSHVGHTRHDVLGSWPLIGSDQYRLF